MNAQTAGTVLPGVVDGLVRRLENRLANMGDPTGHYDICSQRAQLHAMTTGITRRRGYKRLGNGSQN